MLEPPKMQHFRALARQAVNMPGALQATQPDAGFRHDVRVVDLGLGGARVEASAGVPEGTPVELVIDTPHLWDPLTLAGTVAWSHALPDPDGGGALVGVRFEHTTGSTVRTLTELLEAEGF